MSGAPNGLSSSAPFDRWFRYPAGFSPKALDRSLRWIKCSSTSRVVDPFAGAASVGTRVLAQEGVFYGIETHPLVAELAALKLRRRTGSGELGDLAAEVGDTARPASTGSEPDLVQRCFDQKTLELLVGLRAEIEALDSKWAPYLRWALLGVLREAANVRVGWPYQRPAKPREPTTRRVAKRFVRRAEAMGADLAALPRGARGHLINGDARTDEAWARLQSAAGATKPNACVTSPPYLNNFDYADATRLELYFLGHVSTWKEMCSEVRAGMVVATTQQTSKTAGQDALAKVEELGKLGTRVVGLTERLAEERERRPRGKEYDRVLPSYILGLRDALSRLHATLEVDARCALVIGDSAPYGVYVNTPRLLGELAQQQGFRVAGSDLLRRRGARWRNNGARHRVELTERLVRLVKL